MKTFKFLLAILNFSFACTIGAFSAQATQSHRPLLWKNRDIPNPDQAVYFFTDGIYRYLGLVYADDSNRVWAGINEKGFAIMNSTSGNIGSGAGSGPDDGEVMKYALKNCATIEEFQYFLDSTNLTGRKTPSNFGVMDSTGEAAIFETGGYKYVRCDAANESLGFLIRANFSLSGDSSRMTGYERYVRGTQLATAGYQNGILDAQYIFEKIVRDLGGPEFDPYPLPYYDTVGSFPFGFLPTTATINRRTTRASVVIVGSSLKVLEAYPGTASGRIDPWSSRKTRPLAGRPDSGSWMWTILGEPCVGIAVPVFFSAQAVPEPISGPGLPKICAAAKSLKEYVYCDLGNGVNTFLLAMVYQKFVPLEAEIFNQTQEQINYWNNNPPTPAQIFEFEENLANRVVQAYEQFKRDKEESYPIDLPGIIVSPNPAFNSIRLIINQEFKETPVRIYDITGKEVEEVTITPGLKILSWAPRNLNTGIYFLIAESKPSIKVKFQFIRS